MVEIEGDDEQRGFLVEKEFGNFKNVKHLFTSFDVVLSYSWHLHLATQNNAEVHSNSSYNETWI